jgi:hypothetical protein
MNTDLKQATATATAEYRGRFAPVEMTCVLRMGIFDFVADMIEVVSAWLCRASNKENNDDIADT